MIAAPQQTTSCWLEKWWQIQKRQCFLMTVYASTLSAACMFFVLFSFFAPLLRKCAVKPVVLKQAVRDITRDAHSFSRLPAGGCKHGAKIVLSYRSGCLGLNCESASWMKIKTESKSDGKMCCFCWILSISQVVMTQWTLDEIKTVLIRCLTRDLYREEGGWSIKGVLSL